MFRATGSVFGPLNVWRNRFAVSIRRFTYLLVLVCLSVGSVLQAYVPAVYAALPYQAETAAADVTLKAGTDTQITLKFKNVGTEPWIAGTKNVAVYLYGKTSVFAHPTWLKDDMPGLLLQSKVLPGQTGSAVFTVRAPATNGTYTERFLLSSGPNTWVKGSVKTVVIHVTGGSSAATTPTVKAPVAAAPASSAPVALTLADAFAWKASLVDKGGIEWQLDPGGHTIVTLAFQNKGTSTWVKEGSYPLWLITQNGRKSLFKDFAWKSDVQTALLSETKVAPGGIGHFTLELRAPNLPGFFQETFQLAIGGKQQVVGSAVTLPIRVSTPPEYAAKGITNSNDNSLAISSTPSSNAGTTNGVYKALLLLKSANTVSLSGNGRLALTYGFKNIGQADWSRVSLRISGVMPALSGKLSSVQDESWYSSIEPVVTTKPTKAGEIGFMGFTIKAPVKMGKYVASFHLYADGQRVDDGELDIPITVTADGYIEPEAVTPAAQPAAPGSVSTLLPLSGDMASLPSEPIIRVGLFATTDDQMVVRSNSGGFSLQQNGVNVCQFSAGEIVTVRYDRSTKISKASGPRCTSQSSGIYIVVADDGLSPLELTDFSRPVSWLPGANDNKFRGKLELRYTPATDLVWIINELPIEYYLKGSGETSNSSPMEYQKALLTAARTYAMYHVNRGTKHANENYIVDAKYDQVYRGYGAEIRNPVVNQGIDATRGQIVTYQGKLAITPYYSRSDGRTRGWTEVWGGSGYPWLVSVQVPWDNGRVLWGHGVGMSATGAIGMANDGKNYQEILKWFYTGTELRAAYK